jgi:hypothetical protein
MHSRASWALGEVIAASGAKLKEDLVSLDWEANNSLRQSQQREEQPMVDVRN